MADDEPKQTQRMWEADLTEPGRRLTRDELAALESMHQCQVLQEIGKNLLFLLMHTRSLEGKLDRLEQYLERIDARYPSADTPMSGLILIDRTGR